MTDEKKWYVELDLYFRDGPFDTREDAIKFGREKAQPGASFRIGTQGCKFMPTISGWDIIESMKNEAREQYGDVADDWMMSFEGGIVSVLSDNLTDVFRKWLARFGEEPNFFDIYNIETIENVEVKK